MICRELLWVTPIFHGFSLKGENGKCCAGYAIVIPFKSYWGSTFIFDNFKAELCAFTRACTLARGKTDNIYTNSTYASGAAHDLGMLQKQHSFLTSHVNKI